MDFETSKENIEQNVLKTTNTTQKIPKLSQSLRQLSNSALRSTRSLLSPSKDSHSQCVQPENKGSHDLSKIVRNETFKRSKIDNPKSVLHEMSPSPAAQMSDLPSSPANSPSKFSTAARKRFQIGREARLQHQSVSLEVEQVVASFKIQADQEKSSSLVSRQLKRKIVSPKKRTSDQHSQVQMNKKLRSKDINRSEESKAESNNKETEALRRMMNFEQQSAPRLLDSMRACAAAASLKDDIEELDSELYCSREGFDIDLENGSEKETENFTEEDQSQVEELHDQNEEVEKTEYHTIETIQVSDEQEEDEAQEDDNDAEGEEQEEQAQEGDQKEQEAIIHHSNQDTASDEFPTDYAALLKNWAQRNENRKTYTRLHVSDSKNENNENSDGENLDIDATVEIPRTHSKKRRLADYIGDVTPTKPLVDKPLSPSILSYRADHQNETSDERNLFKFYYWKGNCSECAQIDMFLKRHDILAPTRTDANSSHLDYAQSLSLCKQVLNIIYLRPKISPSMTGSSPLLLKSLPLSPRKTPTKYSTISSPSSASKRSLLPMLSSQSRFKVKQLRRQSFFQNFPEGSISKMILDHNHGSLPCPALIVGTTMYLGVYDDYFLKSTLFFGSQPSSHVSSPRKDGHCLGSCLSGCVSSSDSVTSIDSSYQS